MCLSVGAHAHWSPVYRSFAKEKTALSPARWLIVNAGTTVTAQTEPDHSHQGIGHVRASEKRVGIPLWPVPTMAGTAASFMARIQLSYVSPGEISSSVKEQQWQRKRTPRLGHFSEGTQADPVGYRDTLHGCSPFNVERLFSFCSAHPSTLFAKYS